VRDVYGEDVATMIAQPKNPGPPARPTPRINGQGNPPAPQ